MTGLLRTPPRGLPWFRRGTMTTLHDLEDMFERFWSEGGDGWGTQLLAPAVDMIETDKSIDLRMDLPGVNAKEIDIQVNGNQLTVSGERKVEKEENGKTYHRMERCVGRFSRSMTLPCNVQDDKVDAKYQDGVLRINLPKSPEATTRHISVKT